MRIISKKTLVDFWDKHPQSETPLTSWYNDIRVNDIKQPSDIKNLYNSASFVAGNRVVFNIGGNKYRLVIKFNTRYTVGFIRFVGTHTEYDKIDVETI